MYGSSDACSPTQVLKLVLKDFDTMELEFYRANNTNALTTIKLAKEVVQKYIERNYC